MCGEPLALGSAREVYINALDTSKVIKFEYKLGSFQNITEWQTWQDMQFTKMGKKWLAPVRAVSPCGRILIQDRAAILSNRMDMVPEKVPAWASDHKLENFGVIGDNVVCIDYGLNLLTSYGNSNRMVKFKPQDLNEGSENE